MLQVMERSKDKNMYDLCSDSVKNDYGFVYEVINLFKDDLEFVCLVADNYIDSLSEAEKIHGTSYPEINILMSSLCGKSLNQYSISAAGFYEYERHRALVSIGRVDDLEVKELPEKKFVGATPFFYVLMILFLLFDFYYLSLLIAHNFPCRVGIYVVTEFFVYSHPIVFGAQFNF